MRLKFAIQLAALSARFLRSHERCIVASAGRTWDGITTVPSSSKRIGLHPLVGVVDRVRMKVKWLAGRRLPKMMGSGAVAQAPSSGRAPFFPSGSHHRPVGLLRLDHDAAFPLELPRATT